MTQDGGERDYGSLLKKALLEIRGLKSDLEAARRQASEPIAIVGVGCRFPGGADSPESYWTILRDAADTIRDAPADRWDRDSDYGPDFAEPATIHTRKGGFLDRIDAFDPGFFGLSENEAAGMDPQQRLLLEVVWEAFENAAIPADGVAGSRTAVFVGITNEADYHVGLLGPPARGGTGISNAVAANRLSFVFDLKGPSVALDTACSSSLVAIHFACRSLRARDTDLAIAAGVNAILSPAWMVAFSMAGMISKSGACRSFDASADGFVRSEGCGAVLLKRLEDARRDGDRVLAIVRGTAVTQNGRGSALTVPHGAALQAAVRDALLDAGVAPAAVGYVEAHGLGSELGDPIEVAALQAVLSEGRAPADRCLIGSAKASMGHSEAASGMGGVIKTILAFRHGAIPPQRHLQALNPHLRLAGTPFSIPTTITSWPPGPKPRIAGVNSFGLGGTNAHVILEAPPAPAEPKAASAPIAAGDGTPHLVILSARSDRALDDLARACGAWLETHATIAIGDLAAVAATGRTQFGKRLALIASRHDALHAGLTRFAAGDRAAALHAARAPEAGPPRIALLFRAHADLEEGPHPLPAVFRVARDRAAARFQALLGETLEPRHVEPGLFVFQQAWLETFRALGVVPQAVLGQGIGEVTAALAAGVVDLDTGLRLAAARERARTGQSLAEGEVGALSFQPPRRTWISELTGGTMPPTRPPAADHWLRQARQAPDPRRGLAALEAIGSDLVIAIGGPRDGSDSWLDPLGTAAGGRREAFLRTLATLYVRGAALDWRALYPRTGRDIELPTYPFQRVRCWLDAAQMRSYRRAPGSLSER
jgi:acyl transferase domain-containing protein